MKPIDIIIIVVAAVIVVGFTAYRIWKKKTGRGGGCGCGCDGCPSKGSCGSAPKTEEKKDA